MFASQAAVATLLFSAIHRAEGPPVVERQRQAAALILGRAAKWPHYNPFGSYESKFRALCHAQQELAPRSWKNARAQVVTL
jgi:hypothetical protein